MLNVSDCAAHLPSPETIYPNDFRNEKMSSQRLLLPSDCRVKRRPATLVLTRRADPCLNPGNGFAFRVIWSIVSVRLRYAAVVFGTPQTPVSRTPFGESQPLVRSPVE